MDGQSAEPGENVFFPIPSGGQGFWDGSFSNFGAVVSHKLGDHQCMSGHQGSWNYAFFGGIRHLQQYKLDVWYMFFSLIVQCLGWYHLMTPWMCQGFYSASARSSWFVAASKSPNWIWKIWRFQLVVMARHLEKRWYRMKPQPKQPKHIVWGVRDSSALGRRVATS